MVLEHYETFLSKEYVVLALHNSYQVIQHSRFLNIPDNCFIVWQGLTELSWFYWQFCLDLFNICMPLNLSLSLIHIIGEGTFIYIGHYCSFFFNKTSCTEKHVHAHIHTPLISACGPEPSACGSLGCLWGPLACELAISGAWRLPYVNTLQAVSSYFSVMRRLWPCAVATVPHEDAGIKVSWILSLPERPLWARFSQYWENRENGNTRFRAETILNQYFWVHLETLKNIFLSFEPTSIDKCGFYVNPLRWQDTLGRNCQLLNTCLTLRKKENNHWV